ncbi:hypothetical protein Taro_039258 [Colocasia esculenta]|uniref:AB hydrolase-1 domain-containing protein n=1 Tax=Colocasia esculenta TaxID=4460 RepID=A0A843WV72_COLES|nr:hypothetical protein [Colocasia esculenta]
MVGSGWKTCRPTRTTEMVPARATVPRSAFLSNCSPRPSPQRPPRLRATALEASSSRCAGQDPAPLGSLEVLGGARRALLPGPDSPGLRLKHYEPFPVLGWNCHLETIFAAFFRSVPDVRLRRECLRTADDGAVALDWVAGDERSLPFEAPVLILLPGLTGGSQNSYVRHMLVRARSKGWRVVVFNSRGCDSPVTTPKLYSASFTGDLSEVVNHVSTRYPKSKVYAIGWSIGANILLQYVGKVIQTISKLVPHLVYV